MSPRSYREWRPVIGRNAWIDPAAAVIGRVTIGEDSSIWPGAHEHPGRRHPARGERALRPDEIARLTESAAHYVALKNEYLRQGPG